MQFYRFLPLLAGLGILSCTEANVVSPGNLFDPSQLLDPDNSEDNKQILDVVRPAFDASHPNIRVREFTTLNGNMLEAVVISGTLKENLHLEAGTPYLLNGRVFIGQDGGPDSNPDYNPQVILSMDPGTTIYAEGPDSALILSRGSRIEAPGTAELPIVFTSISQLERSLGYIEENTSARGEWMGILLNGRAPVNNCTDPSATEGSAACEANGEAGSGKYGGSLADDDSGVLQYLRIEHAGAYYTEENQASAISFQGVGNSTSVNHIQIHNNGDNGIELLGGTVSPKYVLITGAKNDSIYWSNGWTGSLQYLMVKQAEDMADHAIEGNNREVATTPLSNPRISNPRIANFTLIGNSEAPAAIHLHQGTAGYLANGVIAGFSADAINISDDDTRNNLQDGILTIASTLINTTGEDVAGGDDNQNSQALQHIQNSGTIFDYTTISAVNFIPAPTGPVDFAPADLSAKTGLDNAAYAGAFAPEETQSDNWATGWTRSGSLFEDKNICFEDSPDEASPSGIIGDRIICDIVGVIENDLILTNGDRIIYRLKGQVFVGSDGGPREINRRGSVQAVLSITPGVTIIGETVADGLVVSRGSKIEAQGTEAQPVRFTSGHVLSGSISAAELPDTTGHWLGLIINGKSPVNKCTDPSASGGSSACEANGEAGSGKYGGNVAEDNSGILKYVRVEYAGISFAEENQANGIAFQGVGNATTLDYIQIHNNLDDGVEFFGGTVNAKHLVITGAKDDSIDWTDGWTGNLQYAIIEHSAGSDRGLEGDNREGNEGKTPKSMPNISNFTILGYQDQTSGALFRRGTGGHILNGIIVDTALGIDVDGSSNELLVCNSENVSPKPASCPNTPQTDKLSISSVFFRTDDNIKYDAGDDSATETQIMDAIDNMIESDSHSMTGFSFFGRNGQGLIPGTSENSVQVTDPTEISSFFDSVTYVGAVQDDSDKWYLGWTIDADGQVTAK